LEDEKSPAWDNSSHEEFVAYYAEKSVRPEQLLHFRSVRDAILRILPERDGSNTQHEMVDVGCAAGSQCSVWSELGYRVHGLDVNQPLVELARKRAVQAGHEIDYQVGSATSLPWPNQSMDVCIATELLEHIADWRLCLDEFSRILRPKGALFLTTTNRLCPNQHEFNLPFYSWYPVGVKRYFEGLAITTRPDLANNAKYPAVNWFTPYNLAKELARRGFSPLDRFELVDITKTGNVAKLAVMSIRALPPVRFLAHLCLTGTIIAGIKR
jgi:ubiquinone/menaquinone biosynthesis C-methylase UbiE